MHGSMAVGGCGLSNSLKPIRCAVSVVASLAMRMDWESLWKSLLYFDSNGRVFCSDTEEIFVRLAALAHQHMRHCRQHMHSCAGNSNPAISEHMSISAKTAPGLNFFETERSPCRYASNKGRQANKFPTAWASNRSIRNVHPNVLARDHVLELFVFVFSIVFLCLDHFRVRLHWFCFRC